MEAAMATIENLDDLAEFDVTQLADEMLIAQDLVQQGAVNAISFLLHHGCTEETAAAMLYSLRANAQLLRNEASRRGKPGLFESDQLHEGGGNG
jgi:hypothetical protein